MDASLLTSLESCERRAYFEQSWEPDRLHPTEMLRIAIAQALTDPDREDRGEHAGEIIMDLAANRGLDTNIQTKYDMALHHAALADILTSYIQQRYAGRWQRLAPKVGINLTWEPKCLLGPDGEMRRIVLVDHWNEERQASETRSWFSLAEMAAYKLPMTIEVFILGASVIGRRHSYWSKGLLHPRNRKLRFKKHIQKAQGFTESWLPVWREEFDQISREDWLKGMADDGVFEDLTRRIHVDAFQPERIAELRGLIERKTERLYKISDIPDPNYSACDWPRVCNFRRCCFPPTGGLVKPGTNSGYRKRLT